MHNVRRCSRCRAAQPRKSAGEPLPMHPAPASVLLTQSNMNRSPAREWPGGSGCGSGACKGGCGGPDAAQPHSSAPVLLWGCQVRSHAQNASARALVTGGTPTLAASTRATTGHVTLGRQCERNHGEHGRSHACGCACMLEAAGCQEARLHGVRCVHGCGLSRLSCTLPWQATSAGLGASGDSPLECTAS